MAVQIIFETHATTIDNEAGRATGWSPGELSESGRWLAKELGERRRNARIAAVFSSDLQRAVQTAAIAFAGSAIPIYQDARLRECNYGELNGMPIAQLAAERHKRIDEPYPGGQSYRQVVAEMRSFLRDLSANYDGGDVLIIAHSANRWALECLLDGARLKDLVDAPFTWREGWHFTLPTGWTGESPAMAPASE